MCETRSRVLHARVYDFNPTALQEEKKNSLQLFLAYTPRRITTAAALLCIWFRRIQGPACQQHRAAPEHSAAQGGHQNTIGHHLPARAPYRRRLCRSTDRRWVDLGLVSTHCSQRERRCPCNGEPRCRTASEVHLFQTVLHVFVSLCYGNCVYFEPGYCKCLLVVWGLA